MGVYSLAAVFRKAMQAYQHAQETTYCFLFFSRHFALRFVFTRR